MDYYEWYAKGDRDRMRAIYKAGGYTHAVTGPLVDADGYHGQYPTMPRAPSQAEFDHYLNCMEEWHNDGIIPVAFIHPDNWSFEQTRDELTRLYSQPRAKALLPILVPSGWEPAKYEWSSKTWARYFQWARDLNPDALICIHTVSDVDAPAGVDALWNDNNNPGGNGDAWRNVIDNLHVWLIQNGPYDSGTYGHPSQREFAAQFKADGDGQLFHSVAWHLKAGGAGWPTHSAWGNRPIRLVNAECTAYESYWHNLPEPVSFEWGDMAIRNNADGYLDGGTLAVP